MELGDVRENLVVNSAAAGQPENESVGEASGLDFRAGFGNFRRGEGRSPTVLLMPHQEHFVLDSFKC